MRSPYESWVDEADVSAKHDTTEPYRAPNPGKRPSNWWLFCALALFLFASIWSMVATLTLFASAAFGSIVVAFVLNGAAAALLWWGGIGCLRRWRG